MAEDDDKEGAEPSADPAEGDDARADESADAAAEKAAAKLDDAKADKAGGSRRRRRKRPAASAESGSAESGPDEPDEPDGSDDDPAPKTRTKAKVATATATATAADAVAAAKAESEQDEAVDRMDLPKWNRSKVKRKAPKGEERDAFQEGVRQAGKGAVRRAPLLIGGLVVAAGALALGIYLSGRSAEETADHTKLLATAAAYEARGLVTEPEEGRVRPTPTPTAATEEELEAKVTAALGDLASVAAGSPAHRLSRLVAAGRSMQAADFPNAEASYRAYLDEGGADEALAFIAREGLVLAIEAQGRHDDALTELEPLLAGDERGFFRDQGLWHKGRILEGKGDSEGALAVYREYVEAFPLAEASFARDKVVARLTELDPEFVPPPSPQGAPIPGMPNIPMPLQ